MLTGSVVQWYYCGWMCSIGTLDRSWYKRCGMRNGKRPCRGGNTVCLGGLWGLWNRSSLKQAPTIFDSSFLSFFRHWFFFSNACLSSSSFPIGLAVRCLLRWVSSESETPQKLRLTLCCIQNSMFSHHSHSTNVFYKRYAKLAGHSI